MYKNILAYILIGSLVGILIGSLTRNVPLGLIIGIALGMAGYVMQRRGGSLSRGGRASSRRGAYNVLLGKARGDEALVERLIAYEQKRNPRGTRTEWVSDALDRWERDRT
jgi:uncharacterized membrane protein YeaQ/YmgE (transglycosylase-associated protein family)